MLAEKLIANVNYFSENELMALELLKIRFGEDSLHECEGSFSIHDASYTQDLLKTDSHPTHTHHTHTLPLAVL